MTWGGVFKYLPIRKTKGFTLIELLAVIVVLAIIALIAVPIVLNIIEQARKGAAISSARNYIKAVETYLVSSGLDKEKEGLEANKTYMVDMLNNLIEIKGSKPTSGSITTSNNNDIKNANLTINNYVINYDGNNYNIEGKDDTEKEPILYKDTILNGTDPILKGELIPITIDESGKVTYADLYSKWYSYEEKKWANAVILKEKLSNNYKTGDAIKEEDIESYFVWIPKYSYKIFDLGNYTDAPIGEKGESIAKSIDIKFGMEDTNDTESECKTPLISGETGNCAVGKYMTHPAFITMNTKGIWVGKFETGYKDATSTLEAGVSSSEAGKIVIKPNVYSWRNNTVYNFFVASYNYKRDLDSHMIKNTEWGAVAYLSHSIYGINKEININNNSSHKTGYSSLPDLDQSSYPGTYGDGDNYNTTYNTTNGYLASTTGNIAGIYDISGGNIEYMASYIDGQLVSSGFTDETIANYDGKYFDVYNKLSDGATYNYRILGDATGEMGPFITYNDKDNKLRTHNQWYADNANFIYSGSPWVARGGHYHDGVLASQFFLFRYPGGIDFGVGSRLVLAFN